MLVVETIAKIRRGYFVQGKAIKAISRELEGLAEGRAEGDPLGRDRVRLRAAGAAAAEVGAVEEELERLLAANAARSRSVNG